MPDAFGFHMLLHLCAKTFAKLSHRALAKSKHDLHLVPGSDFALEVVGSDLSEGRRRIDAAGNDSMGFTNPPSLAGLRRILVPLKTPLGPVLTYQLPITLFYETAPSRSPQSNTN